MSTIYTLNGKVLKNANNGKWLKKYVDPYNPLGLQQGVYRFEASTGWSPSGYDSSSVQFTRVSLTPNVWDCKILNHSGASNWGYAAAGVTKILGFNGDGIGNYTSAMSFFFKGVKSTCTYIGDLNLVSCTDVSDWFSGSSNVLTHLGNVNLPDCTTADNMFSSTVNIESIGILTFSSSLQSAKSMFESCGWLTAIPDFETSGLSNVNQMFANCYNVESGSLALYQQMSSQSNPPSSHNYTFVNCGRDTVTGAAELAQIPSSWGGKGA